MNNLLEVNDLSKYYPQFHLENINFSLPQGYIMGFIGPNGAGKTTTIKLILNMIRRDTGEIRINGLDNVKDEKQLKQDIGVVFDSHCLCESWNVTDTEKALSPFFEKWDSKVYQKLIAQFHLPPKKAVKEFSRGMQMRLMLACALSHDAKLLILDEPTSGLDPVVRDELLDILVDYISDGKRSILFSTHITPDLEKIADYITFIENGKMVYSGGKDELIDSFRRIMGGLHEINSEQKNKIIGYRENITGFEGLIKTSDMRFFQNSEMEPVTIDEIMVAVHKGGLTDE
jgi:ABC-2 type transport system ATP-binding protein